MKVSVSHLCKILPSQFEEMVFLAGIPQCEIPSGCQAEKAEKVIELANDMNIDLAKFMPAGIMK